MELQHIVLQKEEFVPLSKRAAVNYAKDNIRVNSVYPGAIFIGVAKKHGVRTQEQLGKAFTNQMLLPPHAGNANDIAYAYLYLASDESQLCYWRRINDGW
ncbi:SDR family oxidoreductase [Gracilibacillus sp. HCP3S3_G5_1]|uniref:SDR family oxidoreductase n=1 Tax=unclassified Gracilibacillus TaxID=2625209 RepID=UPI003F8AE604